MVRRGWDSGLDFEEAYRRILNHMLGSGGPYDVILLVQLRNGSRVGEAVEAVRQFCETGQNLMLVRVEKHKDNDVRLMVLPEELRSVEGRQLLSEACSRLSALRSPKAVVKVYCRRTYGFNTYSLRYAFVSYLLKKGVSPSIVAKITGYRSLDHILHYTEVKLAEEVLAGLRGWGASPAEGQAP
ncbi:MAG: Phage integrase family [uncultured Acidilobus sp. OSP8]|jgi:Phage integrase family.|nr:MAG: Phage integrase family [uncultured Acidilobus sp. OSP8]